ncbi:MAG: hypothetical protein PF574_01030 [Candidatus Delongbacteria bacterium]|jgi:hypothetical protein|nr:hypothetical protein [Candidatus Delongbacteria bacterium]
MNIKLFSKNQILASSVLGTTFISITLMLINLKRLKEKSILKIVVLVLTPFIQLTTYVFFESTHHISELFPYTKNICLIVANVFITYLYYRLFFNSNVCNYRKENWLKIILATIIFYIIFVGSMTGFIYYNISYIEQNNSDVKNELFDIEKFKGDIEVK